jgi:hypothetical protein
MVYSNASTPPTMVSKSTHESKLFLLPIPLSRLLGVSLLNSRNCSCVGILGTLNFFLPLGVLLLNSVPGLSI